MKPEKTTPNNWPGDQVRDALAEVGITPAGIARDLSVTPQHVHHVIDGKSVSDRTRRHIARCINKPVETIWPQTYLLKKDPTRVGRPRTKGLYPDRS
ncbi:helix-turn-helix domain-containing protein [Desulfoluna spongiiphila]|uniref:hypothetical protein n=1 Tax=Desulfoluna spongiiphila TaxID=419481 RepID=UPI0012528FE3|nr:hypothetical protein [Desulfoluna spongiiphila]VVS95320.1 lambda repressor-like dna-binding domain superfamily [Desulfoluna spongiiphila]